MALRTLKTFALEDRISWFRKEILKSETARQNYKETIKNLSYNISRYKNKLKKYESELKERSK